MKHTYKLYYTSFVGSPKDRDLVITADNPVQALDLFHSQVQLMETKVATTGLVIRPKLKPADYQINRLTHIYPSVTQKATYIEAEVDIPHTDNPDLTPKPFVKPPETMEMPLNDARKAK